MRFFDTDSLLAYAVFHRDTTEYQLIYDTQNLFLLPIVHPDSILLLSRSLPIVPPPTDFDVVYDTFMCAPTTTPPSLPTQLWSTITKPFSYSIYLPSSYYHIYDSFN